MVAVLFSNHVIMNSRVTNNSHDFVVAVLRKQQEEEQLKREQEEEPSAGRHGHVGCSRK